MIEKTCHLNKDKRYDWKSFLEDSFVTIKYNEDIRVSTNDTSNRLINVDDQNIINDYKVENIAENIKEKSENVIAYYNDMDLDSSKFNREVLLFLMLTQLEIKYFKEFITPRDKFDEIEELHLMRISRSDYDYCSCNFSQRNVVINKENPMIDNYLKIFTENEKSLLNLINKILKKLDVKIEEAGQIDYLNTSMRNIQYANMEKYFFTLFENGIAHYSKLEYKEAIKEFMISKYNYECIIFIRLICANKVDTINFFKLFEFIENDDEINLLSEYRKEKKGSTQVNYDNLLIFSFIGGLIRRFKSQKVIESEITSESLLSTTNHTFDTLVKFYPEIVRILVDCKKSLI